MRVLILLLALAASTVAALNQPHQESPLVMLGHPPQDSIDFAVHSRRVLKVQGQNGRKLAQKTNRLRLAELSSQEESDASDPHLRRLGFKVAGAACGAVVGAICGTVGGTVACVLGGLNDLGSGKIGTAVVSTVGGPLVGAALGAAAGGELGAKGGKSSTGKSAGQ
ncbi:hypothetical protein AC1031_004246 [Aphanomyces cochlioides]|nr:hypothetical protein AC1031_004246 [Aphanomyces cochlioides]